MSTYKSKYKSESRGHRGKKLRVWQNRSHSSPDKVYETIYWENGELTCNCRGWILPKNGNPRTCRHVKSAEFSNEILKQYQARLVPSTEHTEIITPKKYYRMIRVAE